MLTLSYKRSGFVRLEKKKLSELSVQDKNKLK